MSAVSVRVNSGGRMTMCELDAEQNAVLNLLLDGRNVFLSGEGGTGKSQVVRAFLERSAKNIVCLAPTGFAALNLPDAMTIHSFFKFPIDKVLIRPDDIPRIERMSDLLEHVDCIVVDEISMVRADIFRALEMSLRLNGGAPDRPFGGKQIIVVGDFLQLPPVVPDPVIEAGLCAALGGVFAFNTQAWVQAEFIPCYLTNIHRQIDPLYIRLLQKIRTMENGVMDLLNAVKIPVTKFPDDEITLCCRKVDAERINATEMQKIQAASFICRGSTDGRFPEFELPTPRTLILKPGAKAMIICNGRHQRNANGYQYEYVNGEIGTITDYDRTREVIMLKMNDDRVISVHKSIWDNVEYALGKDEDGAINIESKIIGSFKQFPLLPAWAMSIHKAQGKTLDCKVHLHLGSFDCFASGQLYTALSRVRKLADLTIDRPIRYGDIIADRMVLAFLEKTFPRHFH